MPNDATPEFEMSASVRDALDSVCIGSTSLRELIEVSPIPTIDRPEFVGVPLSMLRDALDNAEPDEVLWVRKRPDIEPQRLEFVDGRLVLDRDRRQVIVDGKEVHLRPRVYGLFDLLVSNYGKVVTYQEILDKLWGVNYYKGEKTVQTHITSIRKNLGDELRRLVINVHGVGYIFDDPPSDEA